MNSQTNPNSSEVPLEPLVQTLVEWLRLLVETVGAVVIGIGVLAVVWAFFTQLLFSRHVKFNAIRLTFARYLVIALEFQLAADILSTAVAPTWDQIGKLGAIAVIRTLLNFFLMHEMKMEQAAAEPGSATGSVTGTSTCSAPSR
jgi:uncharacterized membrane protein